MNRKTLIQVALVYGFVCAAWAFYRAASEGEAREFEDWEKLVFFPAWIGKEVSDQMEYNLLILVAIPILIGYSVRYIK